MEMLIVHRSVKGIILLGTRPGETCLKALLKIMEILVIK